MSQGPHHVAWALSAQIARALEQVRKANPGLVCKVTANLFDKDAVLPEDVVVEFRSPQTRKR